MELLPLITIPAIYFLTALLKPYIQPRLPFNLCAMCLAVSATWIALLVMWLLNLPVSEIALAILMGMSISGLMYKAENFYAKHKIRNFWFVRILIIISGFYAVLTLINHQFNELSLVIIVALLLAAISSLLFQKTTHEDVVEEQSKSGKSKSLIKRLDDCC